MTKLAHQKLTGAVIGAYYEVYNHTSRTYPEYIYERAMMEELRRRGMATTNQDEYRIFYKERLVGVQRLDMFVVQEVVVENKVAEHLTPLHKAQTISYLKTVDKDVGLLLMWVYCSTSGVEFQSSIAFISILRRERIPLRRV